MRTNLETMNIMVKENSQEIKAFTNVIGMQMIKQGGKFTFVIDSTTYHELSKQLVFSKVTHYPIMYVMGKEAFDTVKNRPLNGTELIAKERTEHSIKHNRTVEIDVEENNNEELRSGALALLTGKIGYMPSKWDENLCKKMIEKSYEERLIIAGSLIAAEFDRIQKIKK